MGTRTTRTATALFGGVDDQYVIVIKPAFATGRLGLLARGNDLGGDVGATQGIDEGYYNPDVTDIFKSIKCYMFKYQKGRLRE